ncbi:MAG: tetratricopeptide repeat protein [Planctomycetota bacterium]|nr:MAG: tetratricopeptide repeat protein [Planctomycetota bacterium]
MGWWADFKANRELSEARKNVQRARSPWSIGEFIDKCIELGRLDVALEEAEKGVREFPNSESLGEAFKRLIRAKCADELRACRDEVRKAPGPKAYYKLACLYKELRDLDQAVELARKGVELYPNFEGNYIVLADVRYERFQRDLRASDGLQAIELFEKAVDLNRENYRLLFQLAEIYQAVGAKQKAVEKVKMILDFAPDDRKALALLDKVQAMPPSRHEQLKDILEDFERRAASGTVARPGPLAIRYTRQPDQLARKLPLLERVQGFQRAVVLGPSGELLAGYPGGPEENRKYGDVLRKMFAAAVDCSLRMDISTFAKGLLETDSSLTFLVVVDRLQIAVLCSAKVKKDRLQAEVHKFVEHELYL